MRKIASLLLGFILIGNVSVRAAIPEAWKKPALEVVGWFETGGGDWGMVTPDFDCQGVSAGIFQWNVGKGSLKGLLNKFSNNSVLQFMPTYGQEFLRKINESRMSALNYVRSFQKYKNPNNCNALKRGASWTQQGNIFRRELSALMSSEEGQRIQTAVTDQEAERAWELAVEWSAAKRGAGSSPTFKEFVFFYDTLNFNGTFWKSIANYRKVSELKRMKGNKQAYQEAINYLKTERSYKYYQIWEANRNVELWGSKTPIDDDLDLFLHAYLVARSIAKPAAIPFRLNVISRRGTIIFNEGYVNRTLKTFPQLREQP
jgi:hypothetical protein